jgi:hypothetical protein
MGDPGGRGGAGDALVRAFPFFAARARSDDSRETEQSQKTATALKRSWSALSLAETLSPFDLKRAEGHRSGERDSLPVSENALFSSKVGEADIDIVLDIQSIEMPPTLEV